MSTRAKPFKERRSAIMDTPVQESSQAARSAARRSLMPAADGHAEANGEVRLADQLVLSGAALATEGIDVARTAVNGAVQALDTIVVATLDSAEAFVKSSPIEPMAGPTIDVARQVWSTSTTTLNEVLARV
jgi:hypothetical protein